MRRVRRSSISVPAGVFISAAVFVCLFTIHALVRADERVSSRPLGPNAVEWRIDEPNVKQRMTAYPQIRFQPGDRVTINAGGCAQTGGSGATWKRYVDPQGPNADRLYHGLIWIPGATPGLVRIASVISRPQSIPLGIDPAQSYLRLGYEDDDYGDNGYWGHDNGTGDQCRGLPNAYVVVTIEHVNEPLTGIWSADDGGLYYLRQLGSSLWWAGMSAQSPLGANDFQQGVGFTNVFRGTIAGNTISGEWADVPRGGILQQGVLTLDILSGSEIRKRAFSGGFGGSRWVRLGSTPPARMSIVERFNRSMRNDQHSMAEHMSAGDRGSNAGLYRDDVVLFGQLRTLPVANFPGNDTLNRIPRDYPHFMCADKGADDRYKWFDGDAFSDPPDGDIHFDVVVDRTRLDLSPGPDWFHNPRDVQARLDRPTALNNLHAELLMYGRQADADNCSGNVPTLLPGWADINGNSVLLDGRPLNGNQQPNNVVIQTNTRIFHHENDSCQVISLGPWRIGWNPNDSGDRVVKPGQGVRITGVLAFDEHDDPAVEIHPVYSVDFIQDFSRRRPGADLTGVWAATDVGTYYIRQIGNTVWWLGLSRDQGRTFANIFRGTIQGNAIAGEWTDVPIGRFLNNGALTLRGALCINPSCDTAVPVPQANRLGTSTTSNGIFGGYSWEKLYDVP
jgi:hypothetical protein